ncbi:hypothetical protein M407DRAFT_18801 [Tulasnella calospora MUT 4182]|uniref:Transmembrane protein n=1 Tax=Tulasnella calospora MUT 4182 TaxID=1051891 RepID=A0A0C3QT14_9AGAM|nr:hypothetical protein M407DRAFT_18801 [Tulasnella calospora MUT 4182]
MVNWMDPARIQADAAVFSKLMLVCLGLYAWEVIVTFPYDMTIFTGKRKFKYPMVFYFSCRYALFFSLLGINIALNSTTRLNCQALYVFNQLMGNIAIATASTLLMLRTIAIWSRNLMIVVPLCILALGQWGILLHGVITVHAVYSDVARSCVVTDTLPVFLDLIYVYTMGYDLLVLLISSIGLVRTSGRSDLWTLLFQDGIVYFVVAFTANCVATVFLLLDLNPAMNIMATVPAAVASSIVACRGFVRLSTWANKDVYLPTHAEGNGPRPGLSMGAPRGSGTNTSEAAFAGKNSRLGVTKSLNEGVHISMEAYTTTDNRDLPGGKEYDSDVDETGSESENGNGAVRYTRSERAQVKLPEPPRVGFTQDLTTKAQNATDEKR